MLFWKFNNLIKKLSPGKKGSFQGLPLASTLFGYILRSLGFQNRNTQSNMGIFFNMSNQDEPIKTY